jgi:hypothetical protein
MHDFQFAESAAANAQYDEARKDEKNMVYIVVQATDRTVSIQGFDLSDQNRNSLSPGFSVSGLLLGDASHEITPYGSILSDTGILALTAYNANFILGVDLNTGLTVFQVSNIPCPNDICFHPDNENILFVAGGAGIWSSDSHLSVAIPSHGAIYRVDLRDGAVRALSVPGLHALSGIACTAEALLVSQLYSVITVPLGLPPQPSAAAAGLNYSGESRTRHPLLLPGTERAPEVGSQLLWECTTEHATRCFLADNLSWWEGDQLIVAIYREISPFVAALLQHRYVSDVLYVLGKALTAAYLYCAESRTSAFSDAELLPWFHTLDVFPRVHFELLDANTGDRLHIELNCRRLKTPDGSIFDGHVTHVHHHAGKIIFVNFLSKWALVLEDSAVHSALAHAGAQ